MFLSVVVSGFGGLLLTLPLAPLQLLALQALAFRRFARREKARPGIVVGKSLENVWPVTYALPALSTAMLEPRLLLLPPRYVE